MPETVPFSERSPRTQFILAVVIPFVFGAVVGVVLGASAAAYWALSALAALGAILAGLEHPGPREAALRGLAMGAVYGAGVLIAHAVAGTDAEVSLGSFPPFLIVIDAIAGAVLAAIGGLASRKRAGHPESR
jgi:hypothetical protein